jgi:RNA binding exosome subunit
VALERAESEGHFGDPILVLSARVERTDEVREVLAALAHLPADEYDRLVAELDERVDEDCNLFVTLDKQAAYDGEVRLGDGITLRGKVEAYPAKREAALENARDLLEAG